MSNHSTAPTIGEATMTDHSSVDALLDREVDERLLAALGWTSITEGFGGHLYGFMPHPHDLERCAAPSPVDEEGDFAQYVIPALDERGLGEKYEQTMMTRLVEEREAPGPLSYSDMWLSHKAPLSLRARAALAVLEGT